MLNVSQTARALEFIGKAQRFICLAHQNPDGDALGAMLGLTTILEKQFPGKIVVRLCRDDAPSSFQFLVGAQVILHTYDPQSGDLLISLDSAEPKLTDFHESHPRLFQPALAEEDGILTIKIDHHPHGPDFGQLNFVDPEAASSCEIVYDLVRSLDMSISPEAATCLLTGIFTDTGSMMHSNTSARVYRTAAQLITSGADHERIMNEVFRTSKLSTLKLWGRVLEHISISEEGAAIAAVKASDFRATNAHFSELTGAIDYVNSIPGMKFSLLLSERDGKVKGSLRTLHDDVDVSAMAQKFSGGGHKKAAGFSIDGKLEEETRWRVVQDGG